MNRRYDELERLQRLREQGALTEEEFQAEKRRLLGNMPASGAALPPTDDQGEVIDEEARRSRRVLYSILAGIGLIVAVAIGVLLGRTVIGGQAPPEANVAMPENEASAADENLIAPPPPTDVRTMPMQEQLTRAFAAAFNAKDQAQVQIGGRTFVYHPGRLFWVGDKAVLISPASGAGACPDCAGTVAVHYLTPAQDQFQVSGSWPEAVSGTQWNTPPRWRMTSTYTTLPAIWEEGHNRTQGCVSGSATLTELTPSGPVTSGPIRFSYHGKTGLADILLGDTNIEGHVANVQKDVSFDVVYSGDKQFTETWVKQGDRFVLQGGETRVPQCGS
ncbi:MAG TPA: SHOCT domain-containing protein [Allosphingosinicella sp.]|nr:SHOCT domain-containing protein [Allosphingosinicella sp.]